jgi:hypothetical protein
LLKEFGAIQFNRFLEEPYIPPGAMTVIALVLAVAVSGIVGGGLRTRVQSFHRWRCAVGGRNDFLEPDSVAEISSPRCSLASS